ncbi:MAG: hypothetical protein ACJ73N_13555 [Bryobacteraceae bacterium]
MRLAALQSPEDVIVERHAGMAEIFRRQGRKREAEREYRRAITIVENSRHALQLDESRITFLSRVWEIYDSFIAFLAEDGRLREALTAADHSRAATLAQRIEQTRYSRSGIDTVNPQLLAKAEQSVLLIYWLGEDESFLWVSTPTQLKQFQLPSRKDIEHLVTDYQRVVEQPRDPLMERRELGIRLWRLLISPAANLIQPGARVIILPDRSLSRKRPALPKLP